ncbi:NUDIX domain-containing protein [Patescibacteria group bacterium]|nr:NUDIX domain-containing protein [Patescibacteria group bacterium]
MAELGELSFDILMAGLTQEQVWAFPPFTAWMTDLHRYQEQGCRIDSITVFGATMFGPKVGLLYVDAKVVDITGKLVPLTDDKPNTLPCGGMLRGNAATVFFVLTSRETGKKSTILVNQERIHAHGKIDELPAGVMNAGSFTGQAAREIEEELGIKVTEEELIALNPSDGVMPSCGGSNEALQYFLVERTLADKEIEALHDRTTGLAHEGEAIKTLVVALDPATLPTRDGKIWTALGLLRRARPDLAL